MEVEAKDVVATVMGLYVGNTLIPYSEIRSDITGNCAVKVYCRRVLTDEAKKEKKRLYNQSDQAKQSRRKYCQKEEVKQRKREYARKEDVKQRRKDYAKKKRETVTELMSLLKEGKLVINNVEHTQ